MVSSPPVFNSFPVISQSASRRFVSVTIPQVKPLSAGETLGCTSPALPSSTNVMIFIADGRFHMESAMIRNAHIPHLQCFRYDPYSKKMTKEGYDTQKMKAVRRFRHSQRLRLFFPLSFLRIHRVVGFSRQAIETAKSGKVFGLVLGTLGNQGNLSLFNRLSALLKTQNKIVVPFLMAEINPIKLKMIKHVEVCSTSDYKATWFLRRF